MVVSVWDRLNEWLSAAIVASLTWVSAVVPPGALPEAAPTIDGGQSSFMVGWAQQVESPPIEQVGEGTGEDAETLDEGAPLAEETAVADPETLDAGAPPAASTAQDDDVELLDQGAPPATTGQPVETVSVAPAANTATTYVAPEPAPAVATGPVLPPGFGTGRVHAVAGRGETPIGLAECHVGAVTGRAYVGIDCGEDEGASFVGHAPTFEAFPFVLEAEFPFEGDEAFFTEPNFPFGDDEELAAASRDDGSETGVFVSARGGNRERDDEASAAPVIETGGESSESFAQRARDREPRVRVEHQSDRGDKEKKRGRAEANSGEPSAESRKRDRGGSRDGGVSAAGQEQKANEKKSADKKSKGKKTKNDRADRKERKRDRDR